MLNNRFDLEEKINELEGKIGNLIKEEDRKKFVSDLKKSLKKANEESSMQSALELNLQFFEALRIFQNKITELENISIDADPNPNLTQENRQFMIGRLNEMRPLLRTQSNLLVSHVVDLISEEKLWLDKPKMTNYIDFFNKAEKALDNPRNPEPLKDVCSVLDKINPAQSSWESQNVYVYRNVLEGEAAYNQLNPPSLFRNPVAFNNLNPEQKKKVPILVEENRNYKIAASSGGGSMLNVWLILFGVAAIIAGIACLATGPGVIVGIPLFFGGAALAFGAAKCANSGPTSEYMSYIGTSHKKMTPSDRKKYNIYKSGLEVCNKAISIISDVTQYLYKNNLVNDPNLNGIDGRIKPVRG